MEIANKIVANEKAFVLFLGNALQLSGEVTKIGRNLNNDLVISEPLISRFHVVISHKGDKYYIEYLNSTSGTYVGNKRITKTSINSGETILIANMPILFVLENDQMSNESRRNTRAF